MTSLNLGSAILAGGRDRHQQGAAVNVDLALSLVVTRDRSSIASPPCSAVPLHLPRLRRRRGQRQDGFPTREARALASTQPLNSHEDVAGPRR